LAVPLFFAQMRPGTIMGKTAYLYDKIFLAHDTGLSHPECPERLIAIDDKIRSAPYYESLVKVKPSMPDLQYIKTIHTPAYLDRIRQEIEGGAQYLDSMDTEVCPRSYDVALMAAGGCLNMCDTVMSGAALYGFCAIRPPGHHAESDSAEGFCIFNNIAIAARYLQKKHALSRVAIIDWDVHHGNGTQHAFYRDNTVLYISLHQYPHFPGTGSIFEKGDGPGEGFTMNFPMNRGDGDTEYFAIFTSQIIPALNKFRPDIILISAGFDAHRADPLSSINLSTEAYGEFTVMLLDAARQCCQGKIIAFLEGGYHLTALANGVDQVMKAFTEA